MDEEEDLFDLLLDEDFVNAQVGVGKFAHLFYTGLFVFATWCLVDS